MAGRLVVLTAALLAAPFAAVAATDSYQGARVRAVEPMVTLQGAADAGSEEAAANMPFLPGDRVWTDARGRVEFQFADGSLLRVDRRSKLDYDAFEGDDRGEVVLRLWSGSVYVHQRDRGRSPEFRVETPAGLVSLRDGVYRVDVVAAGEIRLSVLEGEAWLEAGERVRVRGGERVFARRGEQPSRPEEFDRTEDDDFARWDAELGDGVEYAAGRNDYLPEEVSPYADDLERNGSWYFEAGVGRVWRPRVSLGWRPYTNGRWAWTAYGWTWVPNESWGWAPFHYGRWDYSSSFGWYWIPGRSWGPAWVSWSVGNDHVGWCPLGYRDRAVVVHDRRRGSAVERAGPGSGAWTYVRRGDLGARDIASRRIDAGAVPTTQMRVVEGAGGQRLGRDLNVAEGSGAVPRNVRTKPSPGDTVPELRSDPSITIPFPVARRHYESEREKHEQDRPSTGAVGAAPRGGRQRMEVAPRTDAAPPAAQGNDGAQQPESVRRRPVPARSEEGDREALRPWFRTLSRPRDEEQSSRSRARDAEQAPPRSRESDQGGERAPERREPRAEPRNPPREDRTPPPPPAHESRDSGRERGAVPRERDRDRGHH